MFDIKINESNIKTSFGERLFEFTFESDTGVTITTIDYGLVTHSDLIRFLNTLESDIRVAIYENNL